MIYSGAPVDMFDALPVAELLVKTVPLKIVECGCCHEPMYLDQATWEFAQADRTARYACLRCVYKAKSIVLPAVDSQVGPN